MDTTLHTEIKLTCVELKDHSMDQSEVNLLITEASVDKIEQVLNSGVRFIRIGGQLVNTNEVKNVYPFNGNSIEQAIALEEDEAKKKVMNYYYQKRKKENKETSSLKHLLDICSNHEWRI